MIAEEAQAADTTLAEEGLGITEVAVSVIKTKEVEDRNRVFRQAALTSTEDGVIAEAEGTAVVAVALVVLAFLRDPRINA